MPNTSPANTIKEFIDFAGKNPGKLNYATNGSGTIAHLTTVLFKAMSDTFMASPRAAALHVLRR